MSLIESGITIILLLSTSIPLVQCMLQIQGQTEIVHRIKRFTPGKKEFSIDEINRYSSEFKSKVKSYYLGCKLNQYEDDHLKTGFSFSRMIPEICVGHCKQHNFNYGLLSKGNTCTCKKFIHKLKSISSSDCFSPCNGRKKQMCGGPNHQLVSAYKVKQKEVKPDYVEKVVVPSYFIGASHKDANRPAIVINKNPEHERAKKIAMARFAWRREFNKRSKAQPGEGIRKRKRLKKPSFEIERLMDKASPHEYKRLQRLAAERDREYKKQLMEESSPKKKIHKPEKPARRNRGHRRENTSHRRGDTARWRGYAAPRRGKTSRRTGNASHRRRSRHGRRKNRRGRNRRRRKRRRRRRRRNRQKKKGLDVNGKQNKFGKGKKSHRTKSRVSVKDDMESESGASVIRETSHPVFTTVFCFSVFLINQSKYS